MCLKGFGRELKVDAALWDSRTETSLLLIELKRKENKNLSEHLPQLFEYLRNCCVYTGQYRASGVLTNLENWIFIEYSVRKELENLA